jgi:hypothetical protein
MTRAEALAQAWPLGIPTYQLRGVDDAIKLVTTCRGQYWFRGHPKVFDSLLPTAHREPFRSARSNIEYWAGQRFRLRARSFALKVPGWDDYLSWLLMMQHHGVPTRLLDWTESILVALYFVACESPDEPGEVWCLCPQALNDHSKWNICMPDDPPVRYLAAAAFLEQKQLLQLEEDLQLTVRPTMPLAIIPPYEFSRMAAQMSRFTIHPSYDGVAVIELLLRSECDLVRYIVPGARKDALRKDLASLGISRETLFHSLESLATTIKEEICEKDFVKVNPPQFEN